MNASQLEISHFWGDSLLRVERFARTRRVTVGPAGRSDFAAPLDAPTVLVDGGVIRGKSSDTGETTADLAPETDVFVDVGSHTFRVRSVVAEPPVPGTFFSHVDWFFVGVTMVFGALVVLGSLFVVFCLLVYLLLEKLIALFSALGLSALMLLLLPIAPPPIPPQPVIAARIELPPPAAPSGPFFVKPTPRPVPTPKPAPTLTPIAIGDILSKKLSRNHQLSKVEPKELPEAVALLRMSSLRDDSETSGLIGVLSAAPASEIFGITGRGEGGGGGTSIAISEGHKSSGTADVSGGVEGGVAGGVEGGVVGGVVFGMEGGGSAPGLGGLGARMDSGARALSEIRDVMEQHRESIDRCYDRELERVPDLEGKLTVLVGILPSGEVKSARVLSSTLSGAPEIGPCVTEAVRHFSFPAHEGGTTYSRYSFVFRRD